MPCLNSWAFLFGVLLCAIAGAGVTGCGEGHLTPLSADQHQVAKICGPTIAAQFASHAPFRLVAPSGEALDHLSLIVEPLRYGSRAEPPRALPAATLYRSSRCLALSRRYHQPLNVIAPESADRPLLGGELKLSAPLAKLVSRLSLVPMTTSLADFRRCGPVEASALKTKGLRALVIWPHDGDPALPPDFIRADSARLNFSLSGPNHAAKPVLPNSRGCLYHDQGEQRLQVRSPKGVLVATRPLAITSKGDVPLILCPRSPNGQLQMAVPELSPSCGSGFVSYCRLALAGRLRPVLGEWLRRLAAAIGTEDCAVVAERLRDGSFSTIEAATAVDAEALRYDLPELSALTIKANLAYLPALPKLAELSISHDDPAPGTLAYALTERQPQLRRLVLAGGPVNLRELPLPQLAHLAVTRAKLRSLNDLSAAKNLTLLDVSSNAISDITPLTELPRLQHLVLKDNPLTDITPLLALPALRGVDVSKLKGLDTAVIRQLKSLEALALRNTAMEQLGWLSPLVKLNRLDIARNAIADLGPLASLKGLSQLRAHRNRIQSIAPLAQLSRLQYLDLAENQVTSLMPLKDLPLLHAFLFEGNPLGTRQKKTTGNCPVEAKSKVIRLFCAR